MKLKKQKRIRKFRGTRYHGHAMKKHKGKGSHGGKGMAGTGKRADQKKSYIIKFKKDYFGKKPGKGWKFKKSKLKEINLGDIAKNLKGEKEINLKNYKILGNGEVRALKGMTIKADSFSKSAREKIERAGGKAVEFKKKVEKEKEEAVEAKEELEKNVV